MGAMRPSVTRIRAKSDICMLLAPWSRTASSPCMPFASHMYRATHACFKRIMTALIRPSSLIFSSWFVERDCSSRSCRNSSSCLTLAAGVISSCTMRSSLSGMFTSCIMSTFFTHTVAVLSCWSCMNFSASLLFRIFCRV